ncbi:MAG: response regulator [Bacteroidetes bacterium]|jgi:DNA-binding response OmpR family regulator|nr:response regulator [Bacteroidota bacterium]
MTSSPTPAPTRPAALSDIVRLELATLGSEVAPSSLRGERAPTGDWVLVAEGNDDLRAYLQACLSPRWNAAAVTDGRAALEYSRTHAPPLVIAGVHLPGMRGAELCRALRARSTAHQPLLLLVGTCAPTSHSADAFLPTPFARRRLVATVHRLFRRAPPAR